VVEVGQVIRGKYKLLRLLGDGGMGSVYEAEHIDLGTHVAIKVLHGDLARKAGLIDRFLQEARVSAQIKSAHVCQVTDVERTPEGNRLPRHGAAPGRAALQRAEAREEARGSDGV
jgi:eukaryotic-like serine/threonine-protein kinase